MKYSTTLLISSALLNRANAYWGHGHVLVARIAYEGLKQEAPAALDSVNKVLSQLTGSTHADLTRYEGKYPFVESATLADKCKPTGGAFQDDWHYINTPFYDEGGKPSDFNHTMPATDVVHAMGAIWKWANHQSGYNTTPYYKSVMGAFGGLENDSVGLSFAMRLLIHYAGDIH